VWPSPSAADFPWRVAGLTPEKIETHADVTLEKGGAGFEITASHLTMSARVPGTDNAKFQEIATKAKTGCPVSNLLKAQIKMDAKLETWAAPAEAAMIQIRKGQAPTQLEHAEFRIR
jgi:OsmC-like protein